MLPANTRSNSPVRKRRTRRLRNEPSVSEMYMWAILRKDRLGYRFRRQYPIGPFTVDFYCPRVKLVVEVDGEQHLESFEADKARDQYLQGLGIMVLRVPSQDIFDVPNFSTWAQIIRQTCESRDLGGS